MVHKNKKRVVVAMSGGMDSSIAAYLLKKRGYEVIGVTMRFDLVEGNRKKHASFGIDAIKDARRIAQMIGIRHYVLNFTKHLREKIIDNFCQEYLKGRTPNPCVRCNQFLKFGILLNKARQMNAQFFATGHYACIVYSRKLKRYLLKKAKDKSKDQSYFLYSIKKENLPFVLMPLGDLTNPQIQSLARRNGLLTATKPASQEICFIDTDYREFLKHRLARMSATMQGGSANYYGGKKYKISTDIKPGPIVNTQGKTLGRHEGICFYTLGQREGLGIALGYRAYVVKIDVRRNIIVVGKEDELYSDGLIAKEINFISIDSFERSILVKAKIRYNHKQTPCRIILLNRNRLKVKFLRPQRAVTPGQSVVFYDRDILLGGGIIKKAY